MALRERLSFLRRPPVVSFLSFVFLLCGIAFATRGAMLAGGTSLDGRFLWSTADHGWHFLYTPAQAHAYLVELGAGGRLLYGWSELTLDLVFPLVYTALFLALLFGLEAPPEGKGEVSAGLLRTTRVLAILGGACDLLENVSLAYLSFATSPSAGPSGFAWVAAVFTGVKMVALISAAVLLIIAVLRARHLRWELAGLVWLWVTAYAMGSGSVWALVAVALLAVVAHWLWLFAAQYLFFLRYPLAGGLLLGFLPQLVLAKGAQSLFGNLLVLSTGRAMFLVSFMATLVALTVMSMTRLVYLTAPYRMKLPLLRSDVKDRVREPATPSTGEDEATREEYVAANRRFLRRMCPWAVEGRAVVFGLLAIPLIFAIWRISPKQSVLWLVGGWLLAVALAVFMQYQGESLVEKLGRALHRGSGASRWRPMLERGPVLPRLFEGFAGKGHAPIAMMALVAMGVYLGLSPIFMDAGASRALANQISPIAYVFLVAGVLVWLSTVTSLVFDRSRVPVGLAVALWLVVGYGVSKSDHFYRIVPDSGRMSELPTPAEVVQARHEGLTGDYITVVAASGGGIKASLWTARVLQGLDQDVGPSLTRSIVLLSTNSGGSVGGMYYTDAFDSSGLSAERLDSVVSAAGQSSLSAVVWGMAYPDLLRVVTGGIWICDVWERMTPWPAPCDRWRSVDRGWAMDRRWEETRRAALGWDEGSGKDGASESAASPRRLGDWVAGVRQGWRPAHIFNATAVETGAAVRIATVRLSDPEGGTGTEPRFAPGSEPREFADLYPKADVDVVTAARLSASFPWVSPLARAWMAPVDIRAVAGPSASDRHKYAAGIDSTAFHLGDGGYFDNFGVYSALDFLHRLDSSVLPGQGAHPIRRVIFIEIRATPEGLGRPTGGGFAYSAIGPLLTMDHVRNSSQIGRNNREIELMREAWAEKGITLCPAVFELTVQGPLSWLLTRDERDSLENAWKGDTLQAHTRMLKQYLEEPDPGPKGCPAALSDGDPPGATAAAVAGGTGR